MKKKPTNLKKREANWYDKVVKECYSPIFETMMLRFAGIRARKVEFLQGTKIQTTLEREPDFIAKIFTDEYPQGEIVIFEVETRFSKTQIYRMVEQFGIATRKWKLPVRQFLIYIGDGKPKYQSELTMPWAYFSYKVHLLSEIPCEDFLESEFAEEVIFAVLANFGDRTAEEVIRLILQRLLVLKGKTTETLRFLNQLKVISQLRNLHAQTFKLSRDMYTYDMEKDPVYVEGVQIGVEIGFEKGIEKGIEKGLEKGALMHAETTVKNMLAKGFEESIIADVAGVTIEFVRQVKLKMGKKGRTT